MIKVFDAEQIREADRYTIENEAIQSIDLMERAANSAFLMLLNLYKDRQNFHIFCGVGNNGGDGLVIARLLQEAGMNAKVTIVEYSDNYSSDFTTNLNRLPIEPSFLKECPDSLSTSEEEVIVDAIFGTGLSRRVEGFTAELIQLINDKSNDVVSIDLPSGLFSEEERELDEIVAIQANHSLTFQFPKLSMLLPAYSNFIGYWHLIDIQLSKKYISSTPTNHYYFTQADASAIIKGRSLYSHKGDYGRALLISGSKGKMGAAVLASDACMRAGIGLLTVHIPKIGNTILQSAVPEAMVLLDEEDNFLSQYMAKGNFQAIGVGPGIGTQEQTQSMLKLLIQNTSSPIVFDADALNILSENKTWLSFLPKGSILTPHPGEFKRLVGQWSNDIERLEKQKDLSKKYSIYIVLKGRHTSISCPDGRVYFNSTGNPGMATAGSGDSLTGIITSFLAQNYAAEQAALLGVFMHGLSGDIAAEEKGQTSVIARDLIDFLPHAFKRIKDQ